MSRALLSADKPGFERPAKTEGPEPLRGFPTPDSSVVFPLHSRLWGGWVTAGEGLSRPALSISSFIQHLLLLFHDSMGGCAWWEAVARKLVPLPSLESQHP